MVTTTIDPLSTMNVLVVEDQMPTRNMIHDVLKTIGVGHIYLAADGAEAYDIFLQADRLIDLVVCDWNMPRMSGLDLLAKIRARNADIPFLMVTGRADVNSVKSAKLQGVDAYIVKPFTGGQIEVKLRVLAKKKKPA
jgi:two-component system chemotaxis response regulator CheY